jgi:hypothetical protein
VCVWVGVCVCVAGRRGGAFEKSSGVFSADVPNVALACEGSAHERDGTHAAPRGGCSRAERSVEGGVAAQEQPTVVAAGAP